MAVDSDEKRITSDEELDHIRAVLPQYVTGKRLIHVRSVELETNALCNVYLPLFDLAEYRGDCLAAALLHDITKQYSDGEQLLLYQKYKIPLSFEEIHSPAVFHSRTGAYFAKEHFLVNERVFGAIFNHTLGKPNMNLFEKLIFLADFIEPERTHKGCIDLRRSFYAQLAELDLQDKTAFSLLLNRTLVQAFDSTISHLLQENKVIHPDAVAARNSLIQTIQDITGRALHSDE